MASRGGAFPLVVAMCLRKLVKFYEFGEGCCSSTYVSRRIKLTNVCVADEHSSTGWLWREPAAFAVAAGGEPRSAARASTSRQQGRGSSMPPAEITYVHAHTLHIIFEKINYASYVRRRTCLLFFRAVACFCIVVDRSYTCAYTADRACLICAVWRGVDHESASRELLESC
jgi:hypothetical protein